MPLDPEVAVFVAKMNEAEAKPTELCTPAEARLAGWDWDQFMGPPEPVGSVEHGFIPGPTADLPYRLYRPTLGESLPALVYFHGSGFTTGNIGIADAAHRALANRTGCAILAVNYQKSPEHPFPAPFDDAYAATCWASENADRLGFDSRALGVGGDSAGANLAAAVCLKARDSAGPALALQLLLYPSLDRKFDYPSSLEFADGYLLTLPAMHWYWDNYLQDPRDADNPLACPSRAKSHAELPPAIVLTAEYDPLRDDGKAYADALSAAGVEVRYGSYPGLTHAFLWMAGVSQACRDALSDIGVQVRAVLGDRASA
jgi:acetyl esterase